MSADFPPKHRRWRLWQVEPAAACNLRCVMCPWIRFRREAGEGVMSRNIWAALRPHLAEVRSVDFTGGGEPLLQPDLAEWISASKSAGCEAGFLTNGVLLTRERARRLTKLLAKARRVAQKRKIETSAFSFLPDELPVCDQDPRDSLFIRHDGYVAPCINLAIGGETTFLGQTATLPNVHYGRLPDQSLPDLWETDSCRFFRNRFRQRVFAHDAKIVGSTFEASLIRLQETFEAARAAMPKAPEGCRVCHYLYGV